MLHQIIYDSTLQYRACIEQFMDKCDECLVYLKNCIQAGKCTEEQKYVIKGLDSWMDIKGYQMIADTVQKMSMDDEKKALEFIEFYEFMLQCSSEDIEKLIDYLFFIPEQFMKLFKKENNAIQWQIEETSTNQKYYSYIMLKKGIFDKIPFFRIRGGQI